MLRLFGWRLLSEHCGLGIFEWPPEKRFIHHEEIYGTHQHGIDDNDKDDERKRRNPGQENRFALTIYCENKPNAGGKEIYPKHDAMPYHKGRGCPTCRILRQYLCGRSKKPLGFSLKMRPYKSLE